MAKGKNKYVSFAAQREQCRLNKFTYTEKCSCGIVSLMCNYPFGTANHKKGMCRASTCTDMRKTLAADVDEILSEETPMEAVKDESSQVEGTTRTDSEAQEAEGEALYVEPLHKSTKEEIDAAEYAGEDNACLEEDPKGAVRAE